MSRPVQRLPGTFYLLTRRVHRREYRLRPGQSFEQGIGILVARAAKSAGVRVVQLVVMSNHLHAVIWDPGGSASEFLRDALSGIARLANYVHCRSGHFWQQDDGRGLKALRDLGAVEDAVTYCHVNPTAAGLVADPTAWPGINTDPAWIGTDHAVVFERSAELFRKGGAVPMREELVLGLPDCVDAGAFRDRVKESVKRQVQAIRAKLRAERRSFLGSKAVLATDIFASPTTPEPTNAGRGAQPVERVAARDPKLKEEAVEYLALFERAYAECRLRIANGEHDVVLPAGTYHLWRHRGFQREDDPPPEQVFKAA